MRAYPENDEPGPLAGVREPNTHATVGVCRAPEPVFMVRTVRTFALALFALLCCIAPHAGALDGRFHPALARAVAHLDRARGPEAYTALREIWSTWDRADPTQVEEALLAAEQDTRLAAPIRA